MSWIDAGEAAGVPARGARVLRIDGRNIAIFRTSAGALYALHDQCPHRGGPLSQGIVHGDCVTCPLHDWVINLSTGQATGVDEGATVTYPVRVEEGRVLVNL